MLYEVRFTAYFNSITIPDQIKQSLVSVWQHAKVINPCTPEQEVSIVEVLKNHHDEHPHQPCEVIFHKDNAPVCP